MSFSSSRRLLVTLSAGALLALSIGGVSVASAEVIHCDRPDRHGEFDCTLATPPPPPAPNPTSQPETLCVQAVASDRPNSPAYAAALGAVLKSTPGAPQGVDYVTALSQPGPDYQKICQQAAAAALPVPTVSASDRYSTSNGVKTSQQMQAELISSGYAGPFDVPSLLAVYQRTTTSPVRSL